MKNPKKIKCPTCKGKGELTICGTCNGTGQIHFGNDEGTVEIIKSNCTVHGGYISKKCPDCLGPVMNFKEQ